MSVRIFLLFAFIVSSFTACTHTRFEKLQKIPTARNRTPNDALLSGAFSMANAPSFDCSDTDQARINEIIAELEDGYGGTIVGTDGGDPVIDSPAFLVRYLRRFLQPGVRYTPRLIYTIQTLQNRLWSNRETLDDPRLDWDIWRAYLVHENYIEHGGKHAYWYETKGTNYDGYSTAEDLVELYLKGNGTRILNNESRRRWWINVLTANMSNKAGKRMRRKFLLDLVSLTDTKTSELPDLIDEDLRGPTERKPSRYDQFYKLESENVARGLQPNFVDAIEMISAPLQLSVEIWGVNLANVPLTKAVESNVIGGGPSQIYDPRFVLSQESWTASEDNSNQYELTSTGSEGVRFYTYNARLYVWPKTRTNDAIVQLLFVSGFIDKERQLKFLENGFKRLETTHTTDVKAAK